MSIVSEKFFPEFYFENDQAGKVSSFSVRKSEKMGVCGYYVSADADKKFDGKTAAELHFDCSNMPFTAIYSHSLYWVQPKFGDTPCEIPAKTAAVIFKNAEGDYTYIMTAIGSEYKTYIRGKENGVVIYLYSQYPSCAINDQLSFIVGRGQSITELVNRGAAAMCAFMDNGLKLRGDKTMPEVFEYFGWCSWDAFQIRVNHSGLLEKAKEFSDKSVPVKYAIIDDMWGDAPNLKTSPVGAAFSDMVKVMHASPLNAFEGDPDRFPQGLAAAVSDLKASGIEKIGLWFPTTGYWYGLVKDGPAHKMQTGNVEPCAGGRIIAIPEERTASNYFDIFCGKAKDFGCDFVKIDNQSCHFFYDGMYPIGKSSRAMQRAIDAAAFKHFGGALINCMGMPAECMLNRPESAVSRCSDDFMPESKSWFAKNILECAYNGLLQGRFYINDWDMWWTDDAQAEKNALCHAISGGPIYVSDKLGRTNPDVLKALMFDDGKLLRLDDSAMPTEDCIIGNPTKCRRPFKIRNVFSGGGAVAAFNISENNICVSGTVSAMDAGLDESRSYMYYEYFTGDFGYVNGDEYIHFSLEDNDKFNYYTFIEKSKNDILFIGRTDKFNPRQAVVRESRGEVELYEGGEFAFIADEDYIVCDENGNEVECERFGILVKGTVPRENKVLKFIKYDT